MVPMAMRRATRTVFVLHLMWAGKLSDVGTQCFFRYSGTLFFLIVRFYVLVHLFVRLCVFMSLFVPCLFAC